MPQVRFLPGAPPELIRTVASTHLTFIVEPAKQPFYLIYFQKVIELHSHNMTSSEIAKSIGISVRTVRRIISKYRAQNNKA